MSVTVALRASGIGQQFEEPSDEGRVLSQARRTLFVEAANQPILHHQIKRRRTGDHRVDGAAAH
jgi:hypothetical protein